MTNGIGNPDWQRRYSFSAVPLLELTYSDSANSVSGLIDSNGFQYLLVTTNSSGSNTFDHVKVDWFQDANASIQQGTTDYTIQGQSFIVQKIPVVTRYFKLEIGPVGGASGGSIKATIYGTNADQDNLLTQDTAIPMLYAQQSVGAGVILTKTMGGIFGGRVMVSVEQSGNNKWIAWIEYYDWTSQTWKQYWTIFGATYGQSANVDAILPYAPVRLNVQNTDAAANTVTMAIVTP